MLLIPCPYCGERDESEFSYGGRCAEYPALKTNVSNDEWHRAIHLHDNSKDKIDEYWYHEFGCERWIEVTRDINSHQITASANSASISRDKT